MKGRVLTAASAMVLAMGLVTTPVWADKEHGYSGGYEKHGAAHGHYGSYTAHYLRHLLKHQKEIGLTEDQVTKLKALSLDLDRTRIKTGADIAVAERELAALVQDDKSDLAAIEAKLKQSEMLEVDARIAAIKAKRDAMALLTPEQREKEKVTRADDVALEEGRPSRRLQESADDERDGDRTQELSEGRGQRNVPAKRTFVGTVHCEADVSDSMTRPCAASAARFPGDCL
jgi:Spy/CpxP family protein refolding chaperone